MQKSSNEIHISYNIAISAFLILCTLVIMILATACLGHIKIPWLQTAKIIFSKFTGQKGLLNEIEEVITAIVWDVRLPRIITSCAVGGGLAISGVVFQGLLRNPLADPYTLGVSAGAAFGASLALLLNISFFGSFSVALLAFLGACTTLVLVIYLASSSSEFSSYTLILSGIIITAILSAGISFIKYMADEQVSVIIFWLMGSFVSKTWFDAILTLLVSIIGFVICFAYSRDLNLIALGQRSAIALGSDILKVSITLLITVSLITSICVSTSGIIGFIGLLVPHMLRSVVGPDNRILMPLSMVVGAILLLLGDTITRVVLPHEIPIGIITTLIGGPFFCYIFRKRQQEGKLF